STPDATHNLINDATQVRLVRETRVDRKNLSVALDVDAVGTIHHDLSDLIVAQQGFERPMPQDFIGHFLRDPCPVSNGKRRFLATQHCLQGAAHLGGKFTLRQVRIIEPRPKSVDQGLMYSTLHLCKRIPLPAMRGASRGDLARSRSL